MRILLGVSGGIAAYKALEFARLAVREGHSVRVVQTPASLRFVGRSSFAAITGAPVLVSEFEDDPARGAWPGEEAGTHLPISHLAVVERADVLVVAPATANTIARLAVGTGDDLVTTSVLAARCPVIVAPAMNDAMWANPATVGNVRELRDRGMVVLDPGEGSLASKGEQGKGRLVEPAELLTAVTGIGGDLDARTGDWEGRSVIVTAGGTREAIDSVRYIGNRSSGRMGVALVAALTRRGAATTLIGANLQVAVPSGCSLVEVTSASDMEAALEEHFPRCDALFMAAAVADFRPRDPVEGKIDKSAGVPTVELEPVPDLLAGVSAGRRPGQLVVGFAAEHGRDVNRARGKLEAKGLDGIVLNDVSDPDIGFDSGDNEVTLVLRESEVEIPRGSKQAVAEALLNACAARGVLP